MLRTDQGSPINVSKCPVSSNEFRWTQQTELAAELLAEGRFTDQEIANQCGIDRKTLWRWRQDDAFAGRISEHVEAFRAQVRRRGLASVDRRVARLNDHWHRLQAIVEARAEDPAMVDVPGGATGLVLRRVRGIGSGEQFRVVVEHELDLALLREFREIEKQAAQELGQWTERSRVEEVPKGYVTLGPDDLWSDDATSVEVNT